MYATLKKEIKKTAPKRGKSKKKAGGVSQRKAHFVAE
jgi:hypothetical protein